MKTSPYFDSRPSERPKTVYYYFVTGVGEFPYDMLRYDEATPVDSESARKLGWSYADPNASHDEFRRCLHIRSYREPTIARWNSFNWRVSKEAVKC